MHADKVVIYIIIGINYLSNCRKRIVYHDYYFFQELKLTTLPLRQPMLHFHIATSALSNLGSQGRNPSKTSDVGYESDEDDCDEMDEGDAKINSPKLFACPNEGCIRVYKRYGSMVNHVTYGKMRIPT